jgi:hypothetical protein
MGLYMLALSHAIGHWIYQPTINAPLACGAAKPTPPDQLHWATAMSA